MGGGLISSYRQNTERTSKQRSFNIVPLNHIDISTPNFNETRVNFDANLGATKLNNQ